MRSSQFTKICSDLPISHADLAEQLAAGMSAARDPEITLADCPWHYPTDHYSRACRQAWCAAFCITREHGGISTKAHETERRAA